jgi:type I restriction enzyme S subunit
MELSSWVARICAKHQGHGMPYEVNEPSAKYLANASYKRTDVGVIPDSWGVKPLRDMSTISSGGTPSRARADFWGGDIPWITTSEVDFSRIEFAEQFISNEGLQNSAAKLLPSGTILLALYGQGKTRGKVGILGIEAATNQACASIEIKRDVSPEFLLHFLTSRYDAIRGMSNGGSQDNLNSGIVKSILVPVPSSAEQRAIATALSDVDTLIAGLEKLIAKKRDLKQAAMQQLLTGQTRLPGFSGEWEEKELGEIALIVKGQQLPSSKSSPDDLIPHYNGGMQPSSFTSQFNTPANTIAISEGGNSCGFVQFINVPFWCGGHCYAVTPKSVVNGFLFQLLKAKQNAIMGLRVGSGLPNVQRTALGLFKVKFPKSTIEQTAIASVLVAIDSELISLESRLYKTRELKQGMMQELLTGRTRLV